MRLRSTMADMHQDLHHLAARSHFDDLARHAAERGSRRRRRALAIPSLRRRPVAHRRPSALRPAL